MIILPKNTAATVYMTLQDKKTISDPFYLFVLNSHVDSTQIAFLITDTSEYPDAYQKFVITEGTDFDGFEGDYTYIVYQKATASTTVVTSDPILETGIARVTGTAETDYEHDLDEDSVVYEQND